MGFTKLKSDASRFGTGESYCFRLSFIPHPLFCAGPRVAMSVSIEFPLAKMEILLFIPHFLLIFLLIGMAHREISLMWYFCCWL